MKFIIRADGNKQIAMGHIMRCLSIGEALKALGQQVIFVTAGEETGGLFADHDFLHQTLHSRYDAMEEELPLWRRLLEKERADFVLVDSYYVSARYLEETGRLAKTGYLDDFGEPLFPVDVLINYNIYGKDMEYEVRYREAGGKTPQAFLLGCEYAPLRAEFREGSRKGKAGKEQTGLQALITTGGGDKYHAALKLCLRLESEMELGLHRNTVFHVVCGPFSEDKEALEALACRRPQFVIRERVARMSELMRECQLAVTAAGSTMYELCSLKVPSVCFYFAENQRRMAECFDRHTGVINAGNLAVEEEAVLARLLVRIGELEADGGLRRKIGREMGALVDGQGAWRTARELVEVCERSRA